MSDPDRVEKMIELRAPRSRVWRAISDGKEIGAWFGLGSPLELVGEFVPGARIDGKWTIDGREVIEHFYTIEKVEPERALVFHKVTFLWSATGTPTQVTLALEPDGNTTKVTATEMPFELTEEAAARAIGQTRGWTEFCCSLKAYLQHGINLRLGKQADHVA